MRDTGIGIRPLLLGKALVKWFAVVAVPVYSIALWGAWLPFSASAQQPGYDEEVITCESRDMGWVHCDIEVANGVDLIRQLSNNSCIRGSEWGTDRSGVWVTLGCRAEFRARRAPGSAAAAGSDGKRQFRRVVRCESNGRPQSCPVRLDGAPVRLLRQLSVLPCRGGATSATKCGPAAAVRAISKWPTSRAASSICRAG
jgi:hypothetical protein